MGDNCPTSTNGDRTHIHFQPKTGMGLGGRAEFQKGHLEQGMQEFGLCTFDKEIVVFNNSK